MPPKKSVAKVVAPVAPTSKRAVPAAKEESDEESSGSPVDTDATEDESEESDEEDDNESDNDEDEEESEGGAESDDSDDDFEQQSSDDDDVQQSDDSDEDAEENVNKAEAEIRKWSRAVGTTRSALIAKEKESGDLQLQQYMHNDDLSSDDEDGEGNNTIGRVPLHWYDAYDHIGYNVAGSKVVKRKGQDKIDLALLQKDDPNGQRTIYDMYNDREVTLSDRDLEIIRRIQSGAYAHPEFNDTPDYSDYYSGTVMDMPLSAAPEPKRRFVPSKWEMMRVMKIVKAMKEGRYKQKDEKKDEEEDKKGPFLIWNDAEDDVIAESRKNQFHLPAPKMPLPGHSESYNPPAEYLLDENEKEKLLDMDPADRPTNFIPEKHDCLRHVPGYGDFVKERFERCLDLYLCPRKLKKRLNIDPETLVPRLPKPKELKPYPNTLCLQFLGHTGAVRSISVSPDGQYLVSGSEDGTVRLWEVDTCLVRYTWDLQAGPVSHVSWNPESNHHLIAAVVGSKVVLIATGTGDADSTEITESHLSALEELVLHPTEETASAAAAESEDDEEVGEDGERRTRRRPTARWHFSKEFEAARTKPKKGSVATEVVKKHGAVVGPRYELHVKEEVNGLSWHYKGDYLAVVAPNAGAAAVSVHQLSKGRTQYPFTKSPGNIQSVVFHPSRPFLFVATQQHVKVFNLVEQKMVKKLMSGCKWLSSIDIHPSGDHLIVGSYDRRVVWFDLDLSSTPYKTLKFHEKAVRSVQYHKRFPLMASAADDGSVHVFHSMVYNDLARNPMIVPLKVLKGHGVIGGAGVFSLAFHPRQPWIFSAGADSIINLYQDI